MLGGNLGEFKSGNYGLDIVREEPCYRQTLVRDRVCVSVSSDLYKIRLLNIEIGPNVLFVRI